MSQESTYCSLVGAGAPELLEAFNGRAVYQNARQRMLVWLSKVRECFDNLGLAARSAHGD